MTSYRLDRGGRIDRAQSLAFTFDGKPLRGVAGDTLASALLAQGQTVMGRSFKYHRPRGVVTANSAEPNALVTLGGSSGRRTPNSRATMVDLYDGLVAESQNRWPSLTHDIGALNGLLSPFLSAGFYYKTFMWPRLSWEKLYEPFIRKAAGLGRAGYLDDPDAYEKRWAHCDLLIVGAGPTGLAAALTAGRAGADVILADEGTEPGGTLLDEVAQIDGASADTFLAGILAELASLPNVRILPRTTVFSWYDDMVFGALERTSGIGRKPDGHAPAERIWRIAAGQAILATGAEERPLVFAGNDRPGVMTASAAITYARRYGVAIGSKVAVFANSAVGNRTAKALAAAGVQVTALIDCRAGGEHRSGIDTLAPAVVTDTWAGRGDAMARLSLGRIDVSIDGRKRSIEADALAMSGGFSPRIHLACHRGGRPIWDDRLGVFLAPTGQAALPTAGSAAGQMTLDRCLADGTRAAVTALALIGRAAVPAEFGPIENDWDAAPIKPLWRVKGGKGKAFVDFQNDVHTADIGLAQREGYDHVELAKRYTTNGMATDQGKLSNINAIGLLAEARGVSPAEVGTTTFRPFYTPVSFGALAGPSRGPDFQPVRRTPVHGWAEQNGAVFVEAGLWMRSSHFPRPGEAHWRQTVDREVATVRASAGLCDMSTLGKIEVFGRDAVTFLDRMYCTRIRTLRVGQTRYGLMLREDGFVYDDGVVCRLGEEHFVVSTSTAMAGPVLAHLEFHAQAVWPELDVSLMSSTDQWAQLAIAGPKSRLILQTLVDDDVSAANLPHLGARSVTLNGGQIAARLFRVSFSGELAFELAVPAAYGDAVAEAIMAAGAPYGICAYGLEAIGVLRIEKGFITHNEINGTATAGDVGAGKFVDRKKPDFIGRRMMDREGLVAPDRPQLVGIRPVDPAATFKTGAHILKSGDGATLENDQGYVTSSAWSPHLTSTIGLALVTAGSSRHGEEVVVWNGLAGETTRATIVSPVFIDPEFARVHG